MGPVRQNPIQRTVSLFICVCITLCTIVAHNIAQNRTDSFPPYPPDNGGGLLFQSQTHQIQSSCSFGKHHTKNHLDRFSYNARLSQTDATSWMSRTVPQLAQSWSAQMKYLYGKQHLIQPYLTNWQIQMHAEHFKHCYTQSARSTNKMLTVSQ